MSLHPPGPRRERVLVYGFAGAGKSTCWVAVAEWLAKTSAPGHVYVVDTDNAWDAYRPVDGRLDDIVTAYPIHEWADYKKAIQEIREKSTPNDWFSIDLADAVWDDAQEGWSMAVEGEDIDEFFLRHTVNETAPGGSYGSNWVQIKRMYRGAGINLIKRYPGHVLCCAAAKTVSPKKGDFGDDAEVVAKYGRIGARPQGQDKLAHLFHTELYIADAPSGYLLSTAKDRQREKVVGKKVTPDFVVAYLIGHAGWRP